MNPPCIYVVMELCTRGSLRDVLTKERPPLLERLEMAHDAVRAVACMHETGFLHRDIKSLNCFLVPVRDDSVGEGAGVRLGDFGESVTMEAAEEQGPRLIGTAQW